jgi:uncharacterized protein YndB with AHSA1/START domain
MFKYVALALLGAVLSLVLWVAARPSHFHVERATHVDAPAEVIFELIEDFRAWPAWSPWEHLDPEMHREYSGPARGAGARYAWSGNDQVGVGNMLITASEPPTRVSIRLEFSAPWRAVNRATLSIRPDAGGSNVTWSMDGESSFVLKAVGLFMDIDASVGRDFERGLTLLRAVAELRARASTP